MATSYVGLDIGSGSVKFAYRGHTQVHVASCALPENIMNDDHELVAPETLAQILAELRKQAHVKVRDVVMVLGDANTYFRHVTLPPMSEAELRLNLPYEFRDYIDEDPEGFAYDYSVDEIPVDEEGNPTSLELYAAAASKALIDERAELLRKAGFRLKVVIPSQMAYSRIMRSHIERNPDDEERSLVFVDIGYERVSLHLFKGYKFKASRTIDFGCRDLDMEIADLKGVDRHVASTYKNTNFEGVLDTPECESFYDRLCFEISKVINFYNFSNADDVERMYVLGGGAEIPQLMDVVRRSFDDMVLQMADVVMPPDVQERGQVGSYIMALAGMLEGEAI